MKKSIYIAMALTLGIISGCGEETPKDSQNSTTLIETNETSAANDDSNSGQEVTVGMVISGSVNEIGDIYDYYQLTVDTAQTVNFTLNGAANTDFDLVLYSSALVSLADSTSLDSNEEIELSLESGQYIVVVEAYEGEGDYTLTIQQAGDSTPTDNGTGGGGTGGGYFIYESNSLMCVQIEVESQAAVNALLADPEVEGYAQGQCSGTWAFSCTGFGGSHTAYWNDSNSVACPFDSAL